MTTIRDTISTALRQGGLSSYERQAEPVVMALEEREAGISKALIDFATENGLTRDQARDVLTGMDMTLPSSGDASSAADEQIAAMQRQIDELQQSLRDLRG